MGKPIVFVKIYYFFANYTKPIFSGTFSCKQLVVTSNDTI